MARRTKRLWTDEEKRSICFLTAAPGVSVAQVARRYAMNANMIFKWLRDPRYAADPETVEDLTTDTPCFLPVEIVDLPRGEDTPSTPDPMAGHRAARFGASSESIEQLQLALETSEIAIAKMTAKLRLPDEEPADNSREKPKRRPIPDHIPRMEVELTTGDDGCAQCGGKLRRLGEDVTEELEYVPGRLIVNRIVRPRFACSGCDTFTQAPLPTRPIERGRPGPGLLAPSHGLQGKPLLGETCACQ